MAYQPKNSTLFDILETSKINKIAHLVIPIICTLFFIQAFRGYVPGLYAAMFHVVFQNPGWIGSLFTLLTIVLFFVPLFSNKLCKAFGQQKIYLISIVVISLLRLIVAARVSSLIETVLDGLIIAFYGIYMSIFLKRLVQNDIGIGLKSKVSIFTLSFITAFLIDATMRTIAFSADPSLVPLHFNPETWFTSQYIWLAVQVPLSLLLIWFTLRTKAVIFPEQPAEGPKDMRNEPWVLNACGLGMVLFLLFNVFLYPGVTAEYTNFDYIFVNPLFIGALILVLLYLLFAKEFSIYTFRSNILLNALLAISLAAFLFLGGLLSMFIAIIVLFVNAHLLIVNMSTIRKTGNQLKQLSKGFTYSILFMVIMTFLHDFTTDHAFTVSALKGLGPVILLIGGFILIIMTILANLQLDKFEKRRSS